MYEFFHLHLAGGEPDNNAPFIQLFIQHFLGTGFFEEIVKALPIFALVIAGSYMTPEMKSKIGVEEPLDGILIGAASGGGFAVMETLLQYVPQDLVNRWTTIALAFRGITGRQATEAALAAMNFDQLRALIQLGSNVLGTAPGIKSLIIRSIDESFGHMAYAGYFGYFIGLSVIKPEQRWKILMIGLVSASIPHALWDTVLSMDTVPLEAAIALLSYAVLAAAVLKAREISPNRSILQPSVIFGGSRSLAPAVVSAPAPAYAPAVAAAPGGLPSGASERSCTRPGWPFSGCHATSPSRWRGGEQWQPVAGRGEIPGDCARAAPARAPGAGSVGPVARRPSRRSNS